MTRVTARRSELRDYQTNFLGGLNLAAEENQLAPNELRRAEECHLNEFGGVVKRGGLQRVSVAAIGGGNPVRGGIGWVTGSTVTQIAVANGKIHTGTYGIPMTWTEKTSALSTTVKPCFAPFRSGTDAMLYIADGGLLNSWDGTNFSENIADSPAVSFIWVYNRRLYGVDGVSEALYVSDLDDGDTLGVTNGGAQFNIRTFAAQALIAGCALGASNILFHRAGVSRFTGWTQDDFAIETGTQGISPDIGTIAPHSIIVAENHVYWLADHGFYRVSESGPVEPISAKIETAINTLDRSLFGRVLSFQNRSRHEVCWYLPDVGVYCFNYRLNQWTGPFRGLWTSGTPHAAWNTVDSSTRPVVMTGFADGFVRRFEPSGVFRDDVLSDGSGGQQYNMIAKCHRMYSRTETREKAYRRAFVHFQPRGSVACRMAWASKYGSGVHSLSASGLDAWGASGTEWGMGTWGGAGTDIDKVPIHGRGEYLDVTLECRDDAGAVFSRVEIQGIDMGERVT